MISNKRFSSAACAILLGAGSFVQANESFDANVAKLADETYAVRMEAKKSLIEMCNKKPELVDAFFRLINDHNADPEQAFISKEIIREVFDKSFFVERGAIGFALDRELIVTSLVNNGPAKNSGIPMGAQLLSVSGKSVKGKQPVEIYSMVHATRPGTKLEMEFVDQDGEKLLYYPEVVARHTIRSDENSEKRRKEAFDEWMERKREELKTD